MLFCINNHIFANYRLISGAMRRSNRVQLKQDVVENVARKKLSKTLKAKKNTKKLKERMQAASVDWCHCKRRRV